MSKRLLVPIVEGHGEQYAVPILLRRWLEHRNYDEHFDVPDEAVKAVGCGALKCPEDPRRHLGIEHYVRGALRAKADGIIAILDADKECLQRAQNGHMALGPYLLARARAVAGDVPITIVVANRTFEAWLLASRQALFRSELVRRDAPLVRLSQPEARPGGKGVMGEYLGERYSPRVHQPGLTGAMSFSPGTRKRSPSYSKLLRELDKLAMAARRRRR